MRITLGNYHVEQQSREARLWLVCILKLEASVHLCAPRSQRALTVYTQRQTALLRPMYPLSAVVGSEAVKFDPRCRPHRLTEELCVSAQGISFRSVQFSNFYSGLSDKHHHKDQQANSGAQQPIESGFSDAKDLFEIRIGLQQKN